MSFSEKPQNDLEQLLAYGGGIEISASNRTPNQLNSLAAYAEVGGGQLCITDSSGLSNDILYEIAAFGKGHVLFKD